MLKPIQISDAVGELVLKIYDDDPGIDVLEKMIQQLLNSETDKYAKQVHECGAMLQARNKENEALRERIAILEGRITQEDVFP